MADLSVVLFNSVSVPGLDQPALTLPLISDKSKGCGFYSSTTGSHSVMYSTTNGFIGQFKMQATLASDPADIDWFDIDGTTLGNAVTPLPDGAIVINFNGNFVWVRGVISAFSAGNINRVLYSHN